VSVEPVVLLPVGFVELLLELVRSAELPVGLLELLLELEVRSAELPVGLLEEEVVALEPVVLALEPVVLAAEFIEEEPEPEPAQLASTSVPE